MNIFFGDAKESISSSGARTRLKKTRRVSDNKKGEHHALAAHTYHPGRYIGLPQSFHTLDYLGCWRIARRVSTREWRFIVEQSQFVDDVFNRFHPFKRNPHPAMAHQPLGLQIHEGGFTRHVAN